MINIEKNFTPQENARCNLCAADIEGLLEKYGCKLMAIPFIALDGRINAEIHVVPDKSNTDLSLLKEVASGRNQ